MWLVFAASLVLGLDTHSRTVPLPAGKTLSIDDTVDVVTGTIELKSP